MPLAAVLIAANCTGDDLGGEEIARVMAGDMAEVFTGDVWVSVGAGEGIPEGARLRTGQDEARIAFGSGEVWFAPQAAAVIGDDWFRLERGEALADSQGALQGRWSDVEVSGEGVYRLALGIAPRVGVYRGQVRVRRVAEVRTLPALREASLTSRRLPAAGQPLTYRTEDPWDRLLLREAVAFDLEAERLVAGLTRTYGTEPRPEGFYAAFTATPERPVETLGGDVGEGRQRHPGEALLRLFLAQSATSPGSPEALDATLRNIIDLRAAGARWGLVATELGVTAARLAEVVDVAQARYTARLTQQAPAGAQSAVPSAGDPGQAPAPPTAPAPAQPAEPPPPPPPSTPAQPPPAPPPSDPDPGGGGGGPAQPQPGSTGLLGLPVKGLVESVVDLLLGGS